MPFYMPVGDIKGAPLAHPGALAAGSDATGPFVGATLRDDASAAQVELPDVLVTNYQLSGHGDAGASSTGEVSHGDLLIVRTLDPGTAEAPSGTGKVLTAALLGNSLGDVAEPTADAAAASSRAGGDSHGGEIESDSFSWGITQSGAHGTSSGGGPQVKALDGATGSGDDVIVDGRIITGQNPPATADVEWKYVTVRAVSVQDDPSGVLGGPFHDLSDLASGGIEAGGSYYTGYVKVSSDAI